MPVSGQLHCPAGEQACSLGGRGRTEPLISRVQLISHEGRENRAITILLGQIGSKVDFYWGGPGELASDCLSQIKESSPEPIS